MAFLLDEESLRSLTRLLQKEVLEGTEAPSEAVRELIGDEGIEYRIELSDNTTITTSSIDEVFALPNSPKRRISSIWISTPYTGRRVRGSIRLKNNRYIPVNYELRGDDKEVGSLAAKLDDHLLGLRPWYSFLTRWSFANIFIFLAFVGLAIAVLAVLAMFAFSRESVMEALKKDDGPDYSGLFALGYVCIIGLLAGLDWIVGRLFPIATFAIGQGIRRNERLNTVRTAVVTTVLLTIPVGILLGYLVP